MILIATTQNENEKLQELQKELRKKGIRTELRRYEDGFGVNSWSVNDLEGYTETAAWSDKEKIRFMESYGRKLGETNETHWEKMQIFIDRYIAEREELVA
jgi:hypothetical protein